MLKILGTLLDLLPKHETSELRTKFSSSVFAFFGSGQILVK